MEVKQTFAIISQSQDGSSYSGILLVESSYYHSLHCKIFANVCCELYLEADDELDDVEACFEGVAEEADEHDGEQHGRGRHVPLLK